jgi:tight adherence protein B
LTVLLLLTVFLIFYVVTGGSLPEADTFRRLLLRFGLPAASAAGCFALTAALFQSLLAGLFWGLLGWFLPNWIEGLIQTKKQARHRAQAGDFITSAAGLYSAGQVTPEVVRTTAERFSEPFGTEFREMLARRELNPNASFPGMFHSLAEKYGLSELKAVSAIISASERAGGPAAAGRGLKRLGQALRMRDRLLTERAKSLVEVKIAGYVVIALLLAGLLADATVWREYFTGGAGGVVSGLASGVIVGLIFMVRKISRSDDLKGV